jgi:hypothetical protein
MPTPLEVRDQLVAECERGFRDEHHWKGWLRKHLVEIKALPVPLRKQVMQAHEQATAIAFSQPRAK